MNPKPATTAPASVANQSGPKKKLKRFPKVRTGCITCKKRRIKCDETKPQCLKCLIGDHYCEGYQVPKPRIPEISRPSTSAQRSLEQPTEERRNLALNAGPAPTNFTSDEARSVQFYLRRTGKILSKYNLSKFSFWTEVLPRAAEQFVSLKYLLVATALQDELLTSHITIPKIERRIEYYYHKSLRDMIHAKPTIENVLLNCLLMVYFETMRGNAGLIYLHVQSASKIIDEWRINETTNDRSMCDLMDEIDMIITDCKTYTNPMPPPPLVIETTYRENDWEELPISDLYYSVEDAEHTLQICMSNLSKSTGQFPLALVRNNAILDQWAIDNRIFQFDEKGKPANSDENLLALFCIAKNMIRTLDTGTTESIADRWQSLFDSVQDLPGVRSARYRKPITAAITVLRHTGATKEQSRSIDRLQGHLGRLIIYEA